MPYLSNPAASAVEHGQQRPGGPLELDHLAGQLVDASRDLRVAAEDLGLDLVDVVLQAGDHRRVAVDDAVEDRVEHRLGPAPSSSGSSSIRLRTAARSGAWLCRTVMHEVRADEDVDLAELDLLDVVEVAGGAQHDEQGVAVALQLRPLVGDDGVLDRQLVQPELLGDGAELRPRSGRYSPIQAIASGSSRSACAVSATVFGLALRLPAL